MYRWIAMDSEYCSMGRWISMIVAAKCGMKLYEGGDLAAVSGEEWLTAEYLRALDERLADMTPEEAGRDMELSRTHEAMKRAVLAAAEAGPCIIHERSAGDILGGRPECLKVLLYNTSMEHKMPRAMADSTYDLKGLSGPELREFIRREDRKRSIYRAGTGGNPWGQKESYDMCLDSDLLGREKCAEILIEAMRNVALDLDECARIIKESSK